VPSSINFGKFSEIVLNSGEIQLTSRLTNEALDNKTNVAEFYEFVKNDPSTNSIIDIEYDASKLVEKSSNQSILNKTDSKGKK